MTLNPTHRLIALAALSVAAIWGVALWIAAASHARWIDVPWVEPVAAAAAHWTAVVGAGRELDGRMAVTRFSGDGEAFLVWRPTPFAADRRPVLRIAVDAFPFNYTLMLAWRRAGQPAADFTRLQVPTGRVQTYLLTRLDQWQGMIEEVALYAYPQAGPALTLGAPITIERVSFEADGWRARIGALLTGWLGADPWTLRSVNTLGSYPDLNEGVRLTPMIFAFFLIGLAVCGLLFRPGPAGWLKLGTGWLLAAVVLINGHWLTSLIGQRQATAQARAQGLAMAPAFDRELARHVAAASERLPPAPEARVFVAAAERIYALRAAWHLLPHNVASVLPGPGRGGGQGVAAGDYLFFYQRPDLLAEARAGRVRVGSDPWPVQLLYQSADGGLLRFVAR